jgi:Uma2 family endonuclease
MLHCYLRHAAKAASCSWPIFDTREKLFAYRLLPSLREYLLLRQDRVHADLYQLGDDGRWQHQVLTRPDEALALRCLDVAVSLRDVYADVPELLT